MVQRYDTKYDKMGTHMEAPFLTNPKVVILVESAVAWNRY